MRLSFLTAAAAAILSSCTVKEERTGCPCLLNLDLDQVIETGNYEEAVTTLVPTPEGVRERELIELSPYMGIGYEVSVPRKVINTSVVCGVGQEFFSESSVNAGTAPVMAFAEAVRCREDRETVEVMLHKQYCRVTLLPEGFDSASEYPFRVRLDASTGALDLCSLEPCGEPFSAMFGDDLTINVPRQADGAPLILDMLADGPEPVFSVDLSAKLAAAGYDWSAEDLADVSVKVDFARMTCSVAVLPWDENSEYMQIDI